MLHAVARTHVRRDSSGQFELERKAEAPFPLMRKPPKGRRIGHLSDFHLGKPLEGGTVPERVDRWLALWDRVGVDVVVVSGDLVEDPGDRVDLLHIRHRLDRAGMPWVVVPGNHDVARPGRPGAFGDLFGSFPRVERHAGMDFVLLDSLGGYPADERTPFERLDARQRGAYSRGRVGPRQLERAEAQLDGACDEARPRIVVVHHHLAAEEAITGESHRAKYPAGMMAPALDAPDVLDWAGELEARALFHGHIHRYWPVYLRENVVAINSGSSTRGRPRPRARLVDLDADGRLTEIWTMELPEA